MSEDNQYDEPKRDSDFVREQERLEIIEDLVRSEIVEWEARKPKGLRAIIFERRVRSWCQSNIDNDQDALGDLAHLGRYLSKLEAGEGSFSYYETSRAIREFGVLGKFAREAASKED